ncbi:MAG: hypothetical protein ACT4OK_00295 [Gemmobacter sp.]
MKIRENTAQRLRLSGFPFGLAVALSCVIAVPCLMAFGYFRAGMLVPGFFLAGVALLLLVGCFGVFVRHRSVTFDQAAQTVTVVERGVLGIRRQVRPIKGLQGATVQAKVVRAQSNTAHARGRRPRDRRIFRPAMVFVGGRTEPIYEDYAGGDAASVIAAALNGWMGLDPLLQRPAAQG